MATGVEVSTPTSPPTSSSEYSFFKSAVIVDDDPALVSVKVASEMPKSCKNSKRISSSSTISALLKNEYSLEDVGGEVGVETSTPVAIVRTSDVPNVVQSDTLAISGTTYTIVEVQPDGEGMTNLRLRT